MPRSLSNLQETQMRFKSFFSLAFTTGLSVTLVVCGAANASTWQPTKNVEFVVPAGTGGGADQMARLIQGIITKNNLMKTSVVVVNKGGGAGAEGFLDIKNAKGDPHKIHHPFGDRRAFQLERHDTCRHAGAG